MITFLNYAKLTDFICAQCGYTESYMLDEGNRAIVRDKWEKV
jgi:predicted nucleic-acid-binding Zn-ribbon protein